MYSDVNWSDGYTHNFWNPEPPANVEVWLTAWVTGMGYVKFSEFKGEIIKEGVTTAGQNVKKAQELPEVEVGGLSHFCQPTG